LLEKANELYVSTMKDWHSEYETLKNNRWVKVFYYLPLITV
jgi:hypothetical protein